MSSGESGRQRAVVALTDGLVAGKQGGGSVFSGYWHHRLHSVLYGMGRTGVLLLFFMA